jgi:hypothetical protein
MSIQVWGLVEFGEAKGVYEYPILGFCRIWGSIKRSMSIQFWGFVEFGEAKEVFGYPILGFSRIWVSIMGLWVSNFGV